MVYSTPLCERFSKLPSALLLQAAEHIDLEHISSELIAKHLCQTESSTGFACGHCQSCQLLKSNTHPDVIFITGEPNAPVIKIDMIRNIQAQLFHPPQIGKYKVILLVHAHKMNSSAANALLKVLEEPPSCVRFILTTTMSQLIPPTILSRCQIHVVLDASDTDSRDYLNIGQYYSTIHPRHEIYLNHQNWLEELYHLSSRQASICQTASKWSKYELIDVLWFLQLTTCSMIKLLCLDEQMDEQIESPKLLKLSHLANIHCVENCYHILDSIQNLIQQIQRHVSVNSTLALEQILTRYLC